MAIDTDPEVLRQMAATTRHAYEQSITHVEAEIKGVIPELMETLTPEGPYGYTILPEVHPDGGVRLPIITTSPLKLIQLRNTEERRGAVGESWAGFCGLIQLSWQHAIQIRQGTPPAPLREAGRPAIRVLRQSPAPVATLAFPGLACSTCFRPTS